MPGEDVLKLLIERGLEAPVIIASGHALPEIEERTAGLGVAQLLQKPWTASQLIAAVSTTCFASEEAAHTPIDL